MRNLITALILVFLLVTVTVRSQLAENPVFVEIIPHYGETYTVNVGGVCGSITYSLDGYITYRIYVVLQDADDCLQAVFGSTENSGAEDCMPDSLDLYFDVPCGIFNHPLAGALVIDNMCQFQFQGIEWDSFLTMGQLCSVNGTEMIWLPMSCDVDWVPELSGDGDCDLFDGQSFFIDGNAFFNVNGVLPNEGNMVLVAQITTCGDICGQFGIQLSDGCIPGQYLTYDAPELNFCQVNPCIAYPMTSFSSYELNCNAIEGVTFLEGGMGFVNYQLYSADDNSWLEDYTEINGDLVLDDLAPGSYYLSMIDSVGCRDTSEVFTITMLPEDYFPLSASASLLSEISCATSGDGSFLVGCMGGFGEVNISMTINDTSMVSLLCDTTLFNLDCGTYSIHWTDEMGCTADTTIVLQCPDSLLATATWTDITCAGMADGNITLSYQGGTGDLTLNFLDPGEPQTLENLSSPGEMIFSNLEEGEYLFNFIDQNGCTFSDTVSLSEPEILSGTMSSQSILMDNEGWACVEPNGGNGGYTYIWSNGSTENCIDSLYPGFYSVLVTDSLGCTWTGGAEIFSSINEAGGTSNSILIFPNPVADVLKFTLIGDQCPCDIRITDMTGRVVVEELNHVAEQLNIGKLTTGNYMLSVRLKDIVYRKGFSKTE